VLPAYVGQRQQPDRNKNSRSIGSAAVKYIFKKEIK
jgi:hypothetical protein